MHLKEKICKLSCALNYRIDLYFHNHRLVTEVDQFNHSDGDINHEIQRKNALKNILAVNSLELILINIILKTIKK